MKVVTGRVRVAYPNLFTPRPKYGDPSKTEYSCMVLIPKRDKATVDKVRAAMKSVAVAKWGESVKMSDIKLWLQDGDQSDKGEAFEDHFFINLKTKNKPGVLGTDHQPMLDPDELQSGDYARVSFNAYTYDNVGGKGVSFGLHNVMKLADGDPIGSRAKAETDFNDGWVEEGVASEAEDDPW